MGLLVYNLLVLHLDDLRVLAGLGRVDRSGRAVVVGLGVQQLGVVALRTDCLAVIGLVKAAGVVVLLAAQLDALSGQDFFSRFQGLGWLLSHLLLVPLLVLLDHVAEQGRVLMPAQEVALRHFTLVVVLVRWNSSGSNRILRLEPNLIGQHDLLRVGPLH